MLVKAGNPKRLRSIRDLTKPKIRFLNRQAGAGTRLLFDWLLRQDGIAAHDVAGYKDVEMTHSAVAAMIASGHADVGLGVEAAARHFGLDFLPLLKEDYYFVTRRSLLRQASVGALVAVLESDEFKREVNRLPGYDASLSGREESGLLATGRRLLQPKDPGS
jgi:molybdate-binding protein